MAQAMLGAGRFWGVALAFRQVPGVVDADDYAGGTIANLSSSRFTPAGTGHAKSGRIRPGAGALRAAARRVLRQP
jgi:peptide methionine sulfoxide reductase MsrA